MTVQASLRELADAFDCQNEEMSGYVNRKTGEVLFPVFPAELAELEEGGEVDEFSEVGDLPEEEIAKYREILNGTDWIQLPDSSTIDSHGIMRDFAESRESETETLALEVAIEGKGAFRRFKDVVGRLRLTDEWHAFKNAKHKDIARTWLESIGLGAIDD
ncbi:MAG: hypothetical protein IT428_13795 [Planctomycetaceae bacterium]|nr:hypothetical protein [Planctomycetaceae bacterium]